MCKQTYYNMLLSLKNKGVIIYKHSNLTNDVDITSLDNDFSYPSAYKEGYIKQESIILHIWRLYLTPEGRKLKTHRDKNMLYMLASLDKGTQAMQSVC